MIINNENFYEVIDILLRTATVYSPSQDFSFSGILFNKERRSVSVRQVYFLLDIENVDIQIDIDPSKPFFNVALRTWMSAPPKMDMNILRKDLIETNKFIGKTEYYANNILNNIKKEEEMVLKRKTRYIFVNGFMPQGHAAVTFSFDANGRPFYSNSRIPKKFVIDSESTIPQECLAPGVTYTCSVEDMGDGTIRIDPVTKFGKTRSGLLISPELFDPVIMPKLDSLEIIHPELMECSNTLDMVEGFNAMPPIHTSTILLYDLLKTFMLCKSSKFELHFQERINSLIMLTNKPQDDKDPLITIYLAVRDYYGGIQEG